MTNMTEPPTFRRSVVYKMRLQQALVILTYNLAQSESQASVCPKTYVLRNLTLNKHTLAILYFFPATQYLASS